MSRKSRNKYDPIEEANRRLLDALSELKEARQIHKAFMSLGKELSRGAGSSILLNIIADAVRALFPDVFFLIQLTEQYPGADFSTTYEGPLRPGAAERIYITRSAVKKTHLEQNPVDQFALEVVDELPFLFEGTAYAIHAPLVSEGQLFGVIHLEAPENIPLADDEEVVLISLANQMALALRNRRLLEETAYLKDYLSEVLEQANALITVTDRDHRILVFNRAMERLLGFEKKEVLGTDLFQWLPPGDCEKLAEEIRKVVDGNGSTGGIEVRMRNRQGELVDLVFYPAALRDRNHRLNSIILVGQDMTQIRQLERQVLEAEKMASMGKLAAGVVHELNNPLTSISVYAEHLAQKLAAGLADPSDAAKAQKILEGARRIQKLTRDLVSYSRPSSDEWEVLIFNEVVEQGLSFCEHIISKADIELIRELDQNVGIVNGNRNRLLQVIVNLVTNACQAMEAGGRLTVSTRKQDGWVVMSVSDTGCGIPEKDLDRIFEPFFTTKKPGEGTGLGLSIVSSIIKHHQGSIRVKSQVGVGTTFEVWLPSAADIKAK